MKIMPALREAISRFFNPMPGPEAGMVQRQADRLDTAAQNLAEHHDVFADLVRNMQRNTTTPRRKASKRAKSK